MKIQAKYLAIIQRLLEIKRRYDPKAKIRKLGEHAVNKEVHSEIGGVSSHSRLREPIKGDGLEMGPYSTEDAQKVASEINKK
jgi:hypothetical protein